MTPGQVRDQHPEIIAACEQMRAAGAIVRLRCIHDFDGNLLAGKAPDDLVLGPIPPDPRERLTAKAPTAPYRGRAR